MNRHGLLFFSTLQQGHLKEYVGSNEENKDAEIYNANVHYQQKISMDKGLYEVKWVFSR